MKRLLASFLLTIVLSARTEAALTLTEIRTASNTHIVAFFKGTDGNVNAANIASPAQWTVNGQPALSLQRFVTQSNQSNHHIYIEVPALVEGTAYNLVTPHGNRAFTFRAREIFCEALKTNQAAYSILATDNHALFAIWLGTGGSKEIAGALPSYEVFEQLSGRQVKTGVLAPVGRDASSGDFVYKIDLAGVPEGGPYKIAVAGYGSSHPFGVGATFSRRLAHIIFRGQYHQRCGCALKAPYARNIRMNPCHATVYDVDGPIGEANIDVSGSERQMKIHGGYHDAGDADRRAYHMANPTVNMVIYEAFPELFKDKQFNIPDMFDADYNITGSGNGMPDILDEAEWGTIVWEQLQNPDGTIHFGTETRGYPSPFNAPMDKDTKRYGTVQTDIRATMVGAGLFMHLARMLAPYKPARSTELARRAELAYTAAGSGMRTPERLYYHIQKYLLTGDEASHAQVIALQNVVDTYPTSTQQTLGYGYGNNNVENPGYFYSYIVEKTRPTDAAVVARFKKAIKDAADRDISVLRSRAYPIGNNPVGSAWGHNVRQPQYACASVLHWGLTKEQPYINAAAQLMSYILGLNPVGISYVTGLGFHQVLNPHDRESAYTKSQGWGTKPGITVFGPGVNPEGTSLPAVTSLPPERQWADNQSAISLTEFTIFETMTHYALYTVLAQGGTWDESQDPFAGAVGILPGKGFRGRPGMVLRSDGRVLKVLLTLQASTPVVGDIFSWDGRRLASLDLGRVESGTRTLSLPLPPSLGRGPGGKSGVLDLRGPGLRLSEKIR